MNTKATLGVGLVGCGRAGAELHLPAIKSVPNANVVALCDVDRTNLESLAKSFEVGAIYEDYRLLLEDPEVDFVAICVPLAHREGMILDAIESRKHLLIEKPLADSSTAARAIQQTVASFGGKVAVGHNLRCHRLAELAREWYQQGRIGDIELVSTIWSTDLGTAGDLPTWRRSLSTGGGVLLEMGIHHFDLVEWILDQSIEEVWCRQQSHLSEVSAAVVTASVEGGGLVNFAFSQESVPRNLIEIVGTEGRIELDLYRFDGLNLYRGAETGGGLKSRFKRASESLFSFPTAARQMRLGGDYVASYGRQWNRLVASVHGGSRVPCTVDDAARSVDLAMAAIESAKQGRQISTYPSI